MHIWPDYENGLEKEGFSRSEYPQCQHWGAAPLPNPVYLELRAAAEAHGPGTRAASAPGRQPPVRRRGRGASPGAGRGLRPPNLAAQGPSWIPRTTPSPTQLLTGPRWRTVANIAASGPSDRAAGPTGGSRRTRTRPAPSAQQPSGSGSALKI
jgi:hypothetical protein